MSDAVANEGGKITGEHLECFAWLADFVRLTGEAGDVIVRRRFVECVMPGRGEWAGGTIVCLGNGRVVRVHEKPSVVFERVLGE